MIGALIAKRTTAAAFDALNRHDLAKFMKIWRDDGAFIYPGDIPESGTYQGKAAVEGWFRRFLEQYPTIRFELQDLCVRNLFDVIGNQVTAAHWKLHLVNRDGREGENSGVTFITSKGGKAILVKDFIFDLGDNFRRNCSAI